MLTVSNGLSLTTLNSKEFTLPSCSFKWGSMYAGSQTLPPPLDGTLLSLLFFSSMMISTPILDNVLAREIYI